MRVRRGALALALVVVTAFVTAGCIGFITGDEPIGVAASEATVGQGALDQTGYSQSRSESLNRTVNVSVADRTRTAEISTEIRGYNRTVSAGSVGEAGLARVTLYAVPAVSIAGQTLNPIGDWSTERLIRLLVPSAGVGSLSFEENRSVRVLGASRTVSRFATTSEVEGTTLETAVHVTRFEHGSDFVVAVAVHPDRLEGEQQRIDRLLRAVEHNADG